MRALVTGISGQDGRYLAELLTAKGYDVVGTVQPGKAGGADDVRACCPQVELLEADLADGASLRAAVTAAAPDEVYNLAAFSSVSASWQQAELASDLNATGVVRLLEALRATGQLDTVRFFQASSSEIFGKVRETPQVETTAMHPRSPYGVAKAFAHHMTVNYRESYGAFACCGILFNHESERRPIDFVTRKITRSVARIALGLQETVVLGNLDVRRDWGFAGDYVDAMWRILQHTEPDDFVIATGTTHSLRDLLQEAFAHVGIEDWEPRVVQDPALFRPADVDLLMGDPSKARDLLGWKPQVDFPSLVQRMVEHDLREQIRRVSTCVLGLGYVGLPLAVALKATGDVVGYDVSAARIAELQAGHSAVEDVRDADLAGLRFTTELPRDASTYVICVPTPLRDGQPDLSAVEAATRSVAHVVGAGDLVVLESTTYPGTTEEVVRPLLLQGRPEGDFLLAYSPERIDPGNPSYGITNTPKVVGGTTAEALQAAVALYRRVTPDVVPVAGTREAEMAKLLENTFRHVNIALVNEMAVFCRELGIDLHDVIAAAATKPFGFMPFYPGPGVGGHCIPVDPSYLSWKVRQLGTSFRFVELAQEVNARMPLYVVARLTDLLNDAGLALSRSRVLCLGVAYKPGVSDCRESPAVEVLRRLRAKGADVAYSDPHVPALALDGDDLQSVPLDDLDAYDAVVVLTPHRGFDLAAVAARSSLVLDTRAAVPAGPGVHRL